MCSGITSGRVLKRELYAQRLQKLIYLHLLTGCFMKISLQFPGTELNVVGFFCISNAGTTICCKSNTFISHCKTTYGVIGGLLLT